MKFYQKARGMGFRKFAAVLLLAALLLLSVMLAAASNNDWCLEFDEYGVCVLHNPDSITG